MESRQTKKPDLSPGLFGLRDLFDPNRQKSARNLEIGALDSVLKNKIAALDALGGRVGQFRKVIASQEAMIQQIDEDLLVIIKR